MSNKFVKLKDVCTFVNGRAYKQDELLDTGKYPVLRVGNFFSKSDWYYSDLELQDDKYCEDGDLLFALSASFGPKTWDGGKVIYHYHIWKIILSENLHREYLYYYLKNESERIKSSGHGATMIHVTKGGMEERDFFLPDIQIQKKASDVLSKVERIIEYKKQQLADLDNLIKSRFVEMFGDPVSNSSDWRIERLSDIGTLGRGVSKHRPRNAPELLGGIYPLIQTGDVANADLYITDYKLTYSDLGLSQSKMWEKGTLCITIAANIAKTSILNFDSCFPDSVVGFIPNMNTNNIFMHYWFSFFQQLLESQAPESAQKNINLQILSELKVIVPPINIQNQFANFVQATDKLKVEVQKSLDKTQVLFDSLMQQYFE